LSNCVILLNFVAIGQTVAEMRPRFDFSRGGCRHLGSLKFPHFNGQNGQNIQTV